MRNVILGIVAVFAFVAASEAGTYRTKTVYRHTHVQTVQCQETQPTPRHRCRCGKNCKCPNCPCRTK